MRPLERIDVISDLIQKIWRFDPDMRFLQLIYGLQTKYSRLHNNIGRIEVADETGYKSIGYDQFCVEDDSFEVFLRAQLEELDNRV